mgnify:CR=1 FL=1
MKTEKAIVFITWDLPLYELAKEVIKDNSSDCGLAYAPMKSIQDEARKFEMRGAKIFISFGITGRLVREAVDIPVISLNIGEEDIIQALIQASALGEKIGIMGFQKTMKRISKLRPILNIDLIWQPNPLLDEVPEAIRKLKDIDVFVGGYYQTSLAREQGMKTILLKPRKEELYEAICTARSFLNKSDESESLGKQSLVYAIMTVQIDGRIVILNKLASEYLGFHPLTSSLISIQEICPQFIKIFDCIEKKESYMNQIAKIGERYFLYHVEPIFQNNVLDYILVSFQDTDAVMTSELTIRKNLSKERNKTTYTLDHIVGNSKCIAESLKLALKYASSLESVLILGETGTGKELYAQGIHHASQRGKGPFVAVNCASIPENILESELFGYVKGAFTGASQNGKTGLFEAAHGGTIFLDEIGEIPYSLQGKLLRVLQERQIRRLGDENIIPIDIRVITATNKDLVKLVREGTFRSDLYFRLNILNLRIPPLRQREKDSLLLAEVFLKEASIRQKKDFYFTEEAKMEILHYQWPGNVRELQNMVYRLGVINERREIGAKDLHNYMIENQLLYEDEKSGFKNTYSLNEALELSGQNKKMAAELLGVSRATLYRMLEKQKNK